MKKSASLHKVHSADSSTNDDILWESFLSARGADEYCQAWLGLICHDTPYIQSAAVLIENTEGNAFVPIAAWPEASPEFSRLSTVVEQVLRDRRGVVQPSLVKEKAVTHVAYPVFAGDRLAAVIALEATCPETEVQKLLRLVHWGSAWLANLLAGRELEIASKGRERVASVLNVVAVALRHKKLQQSLFDVANELRPRFNCDRVAIGLTEHAHVKVAALSEAATFEKNTPLIKAYTAAVEEAYDEGKPIQEKLVQRASTEPETTLTNLKHLALLNVSGATHVLSVPFCQGAECVGVLTLEKSEEKGFSQEDCEWLDAFAALLAPVIIQRRSAERNSLGRLKEECRNVLEKLFGTGNLVWKASATAAFLAIAVLTLVHIDYRVPAKTVIEGEIQRVAAAPFEGFIGASYVRAGDIVREGQALAQLDDRELKIEKARWSSERDQYQNKLREAMASHDLTAVEVVGAQLKQSEAQLALVTEKIERARLVAPYDGLVVSGDLSQQIGSPVESGKKLFEIAPLTSYRVILQVDEREIRHIQAGQKGQLVITGIAGDPMPLTVVKVTPVATAQEGKNFFRVEAKLGETSSRLRPGMEGIGKIEVGSHSLWWILTHSFTDWLRLTLWEWLP